MKRDALKLKTENKIHMKQNFYFQIMAGDGSFPLTPALSPAEREKRSQLFGEATLPFHRITNSGFCSTASEFYKNVQRLFPLPRGEG